MGAWLDYGSQARCSMRRQGAGQGARVAKDPRVVEKHKLLLGKKFPRCPWCHGAGTKFEGNAMICGIKGLVTQAQAWVCEHGADLRPPKKKGK
ncbi:hypothetical protein COU19_00180 [Candidatus Kaiserbacteria bacterium CG10_big_fil_rev_8_21_14_0_10_56_12]|uniref:Uncharacterized protein n=1 Tax=Candidatus Kaiserbacteria bacterium CG10_big_fil_rev_8_21_14_0_10_56_12 TaxID=1974611 RepID=A0A2H0UCV1_9BACT|nr:MAG: hypothetical protein COU19_00180 [Candidatus Kaiserbacteria bacterium CG10_big_fil_rev_8_21_14_0_10_56_12]